jgi:hypothetical protein
MKTRPEIRAELEASNPTTNVNGVVYGPGDAVYEEIMERWIDAVEQTPKPILPDAENYQVRAWMIRGGMDPDLVPQIIAQVVPEGIERKEALMRWDYAVRIPRNFPLVDVIGSQMGLSPQDIDGAWSNILAL